MAPLPAADGGCPLGSGASLKDPPPGPLCTGEQAVAPPSMNTSPFYFFQQGHFGIGLEGDVHAFIHTRVKKSKSRSLLRAARTEGLELCSVDGPRPAAPALPPLGALSAAAASPSPSPLLMLLAAAAAVLLSIRARPSAKTSFAFSRTARAAIATVSSRSSCPGDSEMGPREMLWDATRSEVGGT